MAAGHGTVKLRARTVGADRLARRLGDFAAHDLGRLEREALGEIGREAEIVFQGHAPVRSGRLVRGIAAHWRGGKVVVEANARNPESGYDYVGVTRYGHRVARIVARDDRGGATVLATGRRRGTGNRATLRFTVNGKTLYRHSVAAYHPDSDWAEDALPEVEEAAQRVATELGRRIERTLA